MNYLQNQQSGFTLLEVLIYVALFVIVLGAIILATYNMIEASDKNQYRALIHNEAQFVNHKFISVLNGADSASVSGDGDTLTVVKDGGNIVLTISDSTLTLDDEELNDSIAPIVPTESLDYFMTGAVDNDACPVVGEICLHYSIDSPYYQESFSISRFIR